MRENSLRVLLVEDNPPDADLLVEMLAGQEECFSVVRAECMAQAELYLRQQPLVDALLLDLGLPDSDGLASLERATLAAAHLPIIVLTGMEDEALGVEAVRNGAQDYVAKGQTTPRMLLRVVRHAVERKRLEDSLRQAHQRLQALMNALPVGVSFSDGLSCQHIGGNPAALAQFEVGPEDNLSASAADDGAAGRQIRFFTEGRPISDAELPLQRAVAEKRAIPPMELEVELPSGRRWHAAASAAPIYDSRRNVTGGVAVTVDITDRKQAEKSLRQLRELSERRAAEAQAANEAKSRFLANVSHELRTPMNAIMGMIGLALRKELDSTTRDYLNTARESAVVLLNLLNDLLDSAKIESGNLELEAASFQLRGVLNQVGRALSVRVNEKGLAFHCRVRDDVPDSLVGDEVRLRQVLLNLVGNAIKFTERGEVSVEVRIESQTSEMVRLEFAVGDTGIGILPCDLERIFKPFSQADSSTARRFGGTGLGLSISANLVALMGGRIWAESEPGRGSTFHFAVGFPLAKELPPEQQPSPAISRVPARPLRILLVEDNPANQKLATYILSEAGHSIEVAGDGHQALRMSEDNHYDVIFMDVQMPGMDGLDTTGAIRKREEALGISSWGLEKQSQSRDSESPALIPNPQSPIPSRHVPIIAMTAHAMNGDRERFLAAGMDGYLSKPINAEELFAVVERLALDHAVAPPEFTPPSTDKAEVSAGSVAVFDPELALRRCYDSQEMLGQMVGCLFEEADRLIPQMQIALRADNLQDLARLGHRLKGTLIYLGAEPAVDAAGAVERCGSGGKGEAEKAVKALEQQMELLRPAVAAYRPSEKCGSAP